MIEISFLITSISHDQGWKTLMILLPVLIRVRCWNHIVNVLVAILVLILFFYRFQYIFSVFGIASAPGVKFFIFWFHSFDIIWLRLHFRIRMRLPKKKKILVFVMNSVYNIFARVIISIPANTFFTSPKSLELTKWIHWSIQELVYPPWFKPTILLSQSMNTFLSWVAWLVEKLSRSISTQNFV